jgi:hypothetical protein
MAEHHQHICPVLVFGSGQILLDYILEAHVIRDDVDHIKALLLTLLGMGTAESIDATLLSSFLGGDLDL